MIRLLALALGSAWAASGMAVAQGDTLGKPLDRLVQALKPSVVNIQVSVPIALDGNESGSWEGTGFIADAKQGLIVTNRHVSSRNSPAQYKITLLDGESIDAKEIRLVDFDPWHDFAILKFDPALVKMPLKAVEFGDSNTIKEQDDVFLIGNNEGQNYTVLYGQVINTSQNPHIEGNLNRHSGSFQVVFGNRGGSSGSPLFDKHGKVIGLHFAGTDVTGDELRIEYVVDALRCFASKGSGVAACRGDVGVQLDLMKIADATKHLHLPDSVIGSVLSSPDFKDKNTRDIVVVGKSIPDGPADGQLEPGDVIVKVDDKVVGNDLYRFDKTVDDKVGGKVTVDVMRNGNPVSVTLPVKNTGAQKITEFTAFGGGVFHEITPDLRRRFNIASNGVFMNEAELGSSMDIGTHDEKHPKQRVVVIQAVNGTPTPDLATFSAEIRRLKDGDNIYLTIRDFLANDTAPQAVTITLDLQYFPLRRFKFSKETLKWREDSRQEPVD